MVHSRRVVLIGVVVAALAAGSASAAFAGPVAPSVANQTGYCSNAPAIWTLTLTKDAGQIESDFELQMNAYPLPQTWHFVMKDNGTQFAHGNQTTKGADNSFSVTRYAANQLGTDRIVVNATDRDQPAWYCRAVAKIR